MRNKCTGKHSSVSLCGSNPSLILFSPFLTDLVICSPVLLYGSTPHTAHATGLFIPERSGALSLIILVAQQKSAMHAASAKPLLMVQVTSVSTNVCQADTLPWFYLKLPCIYCITCICIVFPPKIILGKSKPAIDLRIFPRKKSPSQTPKSPKKADNGMWCGRVYVVWMHRIYTLFWHCSVFHQAFACWP